ncbi:D-xylose reductase [Mucor ambiguus]|uniref:D-xylose reductase n=1 Tax=Mucor ambiguus TaxID=91626 RepID=A0A0C9MPB0_9FUNG|nr:D-xylose reductase [Mucor ambiguus]
MTTHKYITLQPTGDKIPLVGFGTARIPAAETEQVIYNAIKTGNRLIDGALLYGNEPEVGKAVRKAIADGIVKREELFIVGKLWNHYHEKQHVKPVFQKTLDNYGLDYIDLYLIHFPLATEYVDPNESINFLSSKKEFNLVKAPLQDTWRELEDLVDAGKIRNIGISNFNVQSTLDLLSYARIPPSVLEIEHHPYLQQRRLVNWAQSQGIQVIAYASFGNAVFTNVPPGTEHLENLMKHPVIVSIAEKNKRDVGQILLAWAVHHNVIVIPKTVNVDRMKSNLDIDGIKLDDEDLQKIAKLEANARFNDFFDSTYGFDFPLFA